MGETRTAPGAHAARRNTGRAAGRRFLGGRTHVDGRPLEITIRGHVESILCSTRRSGKRLGVSGIGRAISFFDLYVRGRAGSYANASLFASPSGMMMSSRCTRAEKR